MSARVESFVEMEKGRRLREEVIVNSEASHPERGTPSGWSQDVAAIHGTKQRTSSRITLRLKAGVSLSGKFAAFHQASCCGETPRC